MSASSFSTAQGGLPGFRLGLALFVVLIAARISLVLLCATEVPFYDEWQRVIDDIAIPLLHHDFHAAVLLAPHNEHVLALSKTIELVLLAANDLQFDNVLVCLISQTIYAGIASVLIMIAAPLFDSRAWLFVIAATLYAALPYDFENIGMGFANSYMFLLAFSCALILLCAFVRRSWVGVAGILGFGIAATLSMGSGFFAAMVGIGIIAIRAKRDDLDFRRVGLFAVALALCVLIGFIFATRAVAAANMLGVAQAAQILLVFALWLPTHVLVRRCLYARDFNAVDLAVLGISLWGLLEILAMIVARSEFRIWLPISRYMEILGVAAFANMGCLARVARNEDTFRFFARWSLPVFATAIVLAAPYAFGWFDVRAAELAAQAQRIARYVDEHDSHAFDNAPFEELAFPSRDYLLNRLNTPDAQYVLGDRFGTRAQPSTLTRFIRSTVANLRAMAWIWWLVAAIVAIGLSKDFWRSAIRRQVSRDDEFA
jgi:hypothetical protein